MQTLGTWLQLIGTATIGFGVVFAWLNVSGRLRRGRVAIGGLVVQLRSAISRRNLRHVDANLSGSGSVTVIPRVKASSEVFRTGTHDQRLRGVENDYGVLKAQLDNLEGSSR